jgi:polyhydroxyalkanoate synthesis regulator phasin
MTDEKKGKGIADLLVEQGMRFATQAAKTVIDDRRGQEAVAAAVGLAQKGMKRLEGVQEQVLHAIGLPSKSDYDDVAKQMARLKRKMRDLKKQVDAAADAKGARASPAPPAGPSAEDDDAGEQGDAG